MIIKEIEVKDYLTKSNLPTSDYVINPYVGCPHGCKYCYASFMKRFTGHKEEWGTFIDIKRCDKSINLKKINNKTVFLSSVTDCYNKFEEKYKITRSILEELVHSNCYLSISTKSKLILRDLDLLEKFKDLTVSMSINTLDENFRCDMDNASTIEERLNTLKELHDNGIYTVLFMSPMFPYITEWKEIIEVSKNYIDEFWFENLNLRGEYKVLIMNYIKDKYPKYYDNYKEIYIDGDMNYWKDLAEQINDYCEKNKIKYINYFYHKELVENKKRQRIKEEKIYDFIIEAKKQTYANENVKKIESSRLNSNDYEYKKDNMIYHDTYFGGTRFLGEEVIYIDNNIYWGMNYYGVTLDEMLGEEAMDNALRPALMMVGEDKEILPVRGPREYVNGEYRYTFEVQGNLDNFSGTETVYKGDEKIYELKCTGGLIK